jgi:CBS domain-containing protein
MRVTRLRAPTACTVGELMTPTLVVAVPKEPLSAAAARMRRHRVGALGVVGGGRLLGILTERDILRATADERDPRATRVDAYMTSCPLTISPDCDAADAVDLMIQWWVRHLPVVEEGRVVGVVSARDLLAMGRRPALEELVSEPW